MSFYAKIDIERLPDDCHYCPYYKYRGFDSVSRCVLNRENVWHEVRDEYLKENCPIVFTEESL